MAPCPTCKESGLACMDILTLAWNAEIPIAVHVAYVRSEVCKNPSAPLVLAILKELPHPLSPYRTLSARFRHASHSNCLGDGLYEASGAD